jgi:hypothetical protein
MMIERPDFIDTMHREGVPLKQRGRDYWALCPFHVEKTPSFKVSPAKQTFYCFGCGAKGDVIDFIMKLHNLYFQNACRYLGIAPGKPPAFDRQWEREKKLKQTYEAALENLYRALCDESRKLHDLWLQVMQNPSSLSEDDAWDYAQKTAHLTEIDYALNILWDGEAEEQAEILREYIKNDIRETTAERTA